MTTLYVVVNKNNNELLEHLKSVDNVTVLTPESDEIRSTFETALQPHGDCVMVSGDLINLREGDIQNLLIANLNLPHADTQPRGVLMFCNGWIFKKKSRCWGLC